jgi:hypothetical protein
VQNYAYESDVFIADVSGHAPFSEMRYQWSNKLIFDQQAAATGWINSIGISAEMLRKAAIRDLSDALPRQPTLDSWNAFGS